MLNLKFKKILFDFLFEKLNLTLNVTLRVLMNLNEDDRYP